MRNVFQHGDKMENVTVGVSVKRGTKAARPSPQWERNTKNQTWLLGKSNEGIVGGINIDATDGRGEFSGRGVVALEDAQYIPSHFGIRWP